LTSFGTIEVSHSHCLNVSGGIFKISSFFQQMVCYSGQTAVFEDASQTIKRLRGVEINAKQIERVCHFYGEKLEEKLEQSMTSYQAPIQVENRKEIHYAMSDGSMLLTREEKWKEVKLGRIFSAHDNIEVSKGHGLITQSHYVAHLGGHQEFLKKFDLWVSCLWNVVFIADGAKWFWNWVETFYPKAIQILDFYHAKEHLCQYASLYFNEKAKADKWCEQQSELLLEDKVEQVIANVAHLQKTNNKKEKQARDNLLHYYGDNLKRMRYKTFKEMGLLIGSGAIESAHRNVIQQRLKLSGQRWTKRGAQQIINLRIANKSNQWNQIVEMTKLAA
jgi:hypothetical protein